MAQKGLPRASYKRAKWGRALYGMEIGIAGRVVISVEKITVVTMSGYTPHP